MTRFVTALLLLVLFAGLTGRARALESAPVTSKRATVTLVTDTDAIAPGIPFRAALRFRLAEGWHTYWKNPGDAGVPAELTLTLPPGATAGPIDWPAPKRVAEGSIMTYAYVGEILLPVTIRTDGGLTLRAHATWLVCKDICVPEEGDFSLVLPVGTPALNAQAPLFAAHDRAVPRVVPWDARIAADGSLFVRGAELRTASVVDAWFIPNVAGQIQDNAEQPLSVGADGILLSLKLTKSFKPENGLSGILSVLDRSGGRTDVVIHAQQGSPPAPARPLAVVLLFAFLGGAILNLMPCVFPILAMKAVGLASGFARGGTRGHALSYAAGVLTTFAALGAALLMARSAGAAAGWGFQFQSPVFVTAMAWVLFGVGLNLSGVFQVSGGLEGVGGRLAGRSGHAGSFFTGLLAVLVATPCTAPFMGVAITAGLAAPPAVTMLVFLTLGLGLAAPYMILAMMPGLGRLIPRPGRWMDVLKQGLAFPMYGAAVWLLWVVSQEVGSTGVLVAAAGAVLLGFAGWTTGLGQSAAASPGSRRAGRALTAAAVLCAIGLLISSAVAQPDAAVTADRQDAFSEARLTALRDAGRPVFVNITAAWCVTCLVNERVALRSDAVRRAFAADNVAYLKGDWTRLDPAITEFLRRNGRDGVPLYVYYPPNGATPVVLPQILTPSDVLAALRRE